MMEPMETMVEAINRLQGDGFKLDLGAEPGARVRCGDCGELVDAQDLTVVEIVRFEGDSNPDDESMLAAVSCPCGHLGLFSSGYGPSAEPDSVEVLKALARRNRAR